VSKQKITIEVSPSKGGKFVAECPECHNTKEGKDQGRAVQLVHGHMVGIHSADPFADITVKRQN
jgi:hypothetical protein